MISSTLRRRNVGNAAEFKNQSADKKEYDLVNQLSDDTNLSVSQPQHEPAQNRDLISRLPDDILIKILSYMHISCATRTSILSTRWRNLYKQVPDIDLNCSDLLRHIQTKVDFGSSILSATSWTNLHKFVSKIERGVNEILRIDHANTTRHDSRLVVGLLHRFLSLRSGSKIHSVRLGCCLDNSVSQLFQQCLYSLGRLGVEKLVLHFFCRRLIYPDVIDFSSQFLLEMPSLKYLELGCCYLVPSLRSQCNSLQNLVLSDVTLPSGALDCILSNCSSLHALRILACKCLSKLTIRGPNLQLKYLEISRCDNVKELELYASNLVVFEFTICGEVKFIFDHVPQLHTVYLSLDEEDIMHYVCGKLAEDVPHLKSLSFFSKVCCFQDSSIWTGMNSFSNLRRLDITLYPSRGINDLLLLAPLLQRCPLLEEFHLHSFLAEYNRPPQGEKQGIVFQSELKKVEISGFFGAENDIEFALHLLKSAIKLEEMHITKCRKIYSAFRRWIPPEYKQSVWSEERHNTIVTRLQGQAVSTTARLIIEHKAQDYKRTIPIEEESFYYD